MAFTKVLGPGIHTLANVTSHNINSSGVVTATKFVGPFDTLSGDYITGIAATFTGNVSIGGTLTYMDVTNVDAVGIITAQEGIHYGIGATAGKFEAATGITTLSSLGIGNTVIPQTKFEVSDTTGARIRVRHTNVGGARDAGFDIWSDDSGTFAAIESLVHSVSA